MIKAEWTGEAVKQMHIHGISQNDIALHIGKSREYVCKIINGIESPQNAEIVIMTAINELIGESK